MINELKVKIGEINCKTPFVRLHTSVLPPKKAHRVRPCELFEYLRIGLFKGPAFKFAQILQIWNKLVPCNRQACPYTTLIIKDIPIGFKNLRIPGHVSGDKS